MYEGTFHAIVAVLRQIVQLVQMGGYDLIQLNYRDSKPIYEQIKDGFRKLIITNSLSANEKLPSVRELEGYTYTVAGKGTFVAEHREILNTRQHELLEEFDEVVEELCFLSVSRSDLITRIEHAAEGGEKV